METFTLQVITLATFTIPNGSVNGCDSIVTLDLTINNSVSGTDTQVACGSFTWIDGNTQVHYTWIEVTIRRHLPFLMEALMVVIHWSHLI